MNKIYEKVGEILDNFKTLKVTTVVVEGADKKVETVIDVLTGDASFKIHKELLPPNVSLAELHNQQVAESKETIARTIEALADLGAKIGDKLEGYVSDDEAAE